MVADSNTPLLGLLLMGTGNDNNAWGDNANNSVFTPLETAIADAVAIATTGGTITLSAGQALYAAIILSGTLTSDVVIVVPDTNKIYRIVNNTVGGGFFTRLKCTTVSTAVNVPAGGKMTTIMAISGTPYRQDSCEVGRYVYDSLNLGGDVIECDNALYKRASLPELFAKISTTFGTTDSTNFRVPDGKTLGKFLRSRTGSVAAGTAQTNQNASHTHTGSGTTSGQSTTHTHTGTSDAPNVSLAHTHTGTSDSTNTDHTHTQQGTFTSGAMSANASHTHSGIPLPAGAGGGGGFSTVNGTTNTNATNTDHTHSVTISGATTAMSANAAHTHTFTTAASGTLTHTHTFTSGNASVDHTHTYSFTTSTGSADGTEARPESLVGILCIRY